jgi:8-oxo-dGTP pyrophosphatase MutT (NUDIX family)
MSTSKVYDKKPLAANAIFFNSKGELLIVKPTYREYWLMPGGGVENDESPRIGCVREIKEELALDKTFDKLAAVDYLVPVDEHYSDALVFLFYGGILTDEEIKAIKLPSEELVEFAFKKPDEAVKMLSERTGKRVKEVLPYLEKHFVYLEDGKKVI